MRLFKRAQHDMLGRVEQNQHPHPPESDGAILWNTTKTVRGRASRPPTLLQKKRPAPYNVILAQAGI